MDIYSINEQIEGIRLATKNASASRESALEFLRQARIIDRDLSDNEQCTSIQKSDELRHHPYRSQNGISYTHTDAVLLVKEAGSKYQGSNKAIKRRNG